MKLLLLFLCLAPLAHSRPGDLDPTFGNSGKVVTYFGGHDSISDIAIQNDGKIVAAGTHNFRSGFVLARYQQNGTLDPSFGKDGVAYTNFEGINQDECECSAIAIDSLGRIVVVGGVGSDYTKDFAVTRYLADGSLDASFGNGGKIVTSIGGGDGAASILIQKDGKIVVTGSREYPSEAVLIRYNENGTLDSHFGIEGIASIKTSTPNYSRLPNGKAILQKDGKIAVAVVTGRSVVLMRVTSEGDLDQTFGFQGIRVSLVHK